MPELTPSTRELARRIGVTETALRKAEANGRIVREPDGHWDVEKTRRRMIETADPLRSRLAGAAGAGTANAGLSGDATPYARLRVAQLALKVEVLRMALDEDKGRLLDAAAANAAIDEIAGAMRDALLNWPARVSGLIAAELGAEPHLVQTVHAHRLSPCGVCQKPTVPLLAGVADRRPDAVQPDGGLRKRCDVENGIRALLREVGLDVRRPSRRTSLPACARRPLTTRCWPAGLNRFWPVNVMTRKSKWLIQRVLDEVRVEPTCRRQMTVPDAGPLTALAFRATIDQPDRFRKSRDAGAHLDLIPRRYQSGETDVQGRISRCGDELARTARYEAAHSLLIQMVGTAGLENECRRAPRHGARTRPGDPQAGSDPAPHVVRRKRVPSGQAGHGADASRVTTRVPVPA